MSLGVGAARAQQGEGRAHVGKLLEVLEWVELGAKPDLTPPSEHPNISFRNTLTSCPRDVPAAARSRPILFFGWEKKGGEGERESARARAAATDHERACRERSGGDATGSHPCRARKERVGKEHCLLLG